MKVPFREKYAFGVGALGKDAVICFVNTFLLFYYTDVLYLSPAFVGTLFFGARVWDAINDPVMGMIIDNTRTRFGKFRIWLVIGTVLNAIVFVLLFTTFNLTGGSLYLYCAIMYVIFGMTYTVMDVPYWSWLPNLTSDPEERERVSVLPRIFASLAGLLTGTFGLQAVNLLGSGDQMKGFQLIAVLIAIAFIIFIGITVTNVPEASTLDQQNAPKLTMKKAVQVIKSNDQLLAFIGLLLTFNLSMQIMNGFMIYYFKYVTGNEALFSLFFFTIFAEMLGLMLFPKISRKISREKTYILACLLPVIGLLILFVAGFIAPTNAIFAMAAGLVLKFGSGLSLGVTTVSIADCIDYGEIKFGTRNESIICSAQTFLMKSSQAVAGLLTGVGLSIVGYVPNAAQSATAILGIRLLTCIVPIFCVIFSYLIYKNWYKLKGQRLLDLSKRITKFHSEANKTQKTNEGVLEEDVNFEV
ncbi:melibiose:sodium transporter MelB [Enterococcus sp. AZ196]|uniref:melibiose:sodium transporter MelB n=1 Tax=Enterococcus sp. AZ196 TaxID=2774659 RepID=UPI003D27849A